jgi:diguanylate cyclase (GGDEF)-like protein
VTLKKTVFLAVSAFFVLVSLVLWTGASMAMRSHLDTLETLEIREDQERLRAAVDDILQGQARVTIDYAHWEEAGRFVRQPYDEFRTANFTWAGLVNLEVNHFLFLDLQGRLVEHYGADILGNEGDSLALPASLLSLLDIRTLRLRIPSDSAVSWIALADTTPYLLSAATVTMGASSEPALGYFVMARALDSSMVDKIAERVRLPLVVRRLPEKQAAVRPASEVAIIKKKGIRESVGLLRMGDGARLEFELRRDRWIEKTGQYDFYVFMAVFFVLMLLLLGILLVFLERRILHPLWRLEKGLDRIGSTGDLSLRMPLAGPVEIQKHAQAINGMLERIAEGERAHYALADSLRGTQVFLAHLVDDLPDATFSVNAQGCVMAWNIAMETFTGTRSEEWNGKTLAEVSELIYGVRRPLLLESFFDASLGDDCFPSRVWKSARSCQFEEFVTHPGGHDGRFLEQTATAIRDGQGVFLGAIQTLRDVTGQRRAEQRMEYLSLHDPLTGLYNRTYYAEVSTGFCVPQNMPVGVVMIDLDGLKLVNDTLGHEHGDTLILAATAILRKAFVDHAVARIGGDEFIVLFSQTHGADIQGLVHTLGRLMREYNEGAPPMPVQMSVGFAWSAHCDDLAEVVKEADAVMYRDKEARREKVRADYVASLQRRFEELYRKEIDPLEKILGLCTAFGSHLSLGLEDVDKLSLLARYRDIGRVGMSGRIFLTPSDLDKDEMAELRKQPEIGHRIARISRELAPIADLILKHREWWDGRGYPLGLSGEQIPYLNRVLAVVEAFAVMTTPRHRRRTLSSADALAELRQMSGQKLDPALVVAFDAFLQNNEKHDA